MGRHAFHLQAEGGILLGSPTDTRTTRSTMAHLYGDDPKLHARAVRALENMKANTPEGVLERAFRSGEPLILGMADGTQRKTNIVAVEAQELHGRRRDPRKARRALRNAPEVCETLQEGRSSWTRRSPLSATGRRATSTSGCG